MDNEVMELIDQLYTMVSEAWGVPLGNEKCIVERDQVLEILDEIKTAMPVELSEAKRLVSARDEFINNAKREAEGIRNQAEERARALVNDQEIVRIAKARSNEMLASTQAKADALRQASSQFCVDALRRTEDAISAALGSVQQAHAAFQGVSGSTAAPAAPAVEEKIDFSNVEIEPLFKDFVDFDTFSKSDFRAVKVKACEAVKKSKKLLKFTLDDGTGEDRVILSGIHQYYEPEELVGKTCIAITNLPPRPMMGIDSCGMLISAVHHENGEEKLHLLMVDPHIPAGAKLY